jgi:hypothetical protein
LKRARPSSSLESTGTQDLGKCILGKPQVVMKGSFAIVSRKLVRCRLPRNDNFWVRKVLICFTSEFVDLDVRATSGAFEKIC